MIELPAISVRYRVRPFREAWVLPEGQVPESTLHSSTIREIWMVLDARVKTLGMDALVVTNLAVRWLEDAPKIGIDPDVAILEPAPHGVSVSSWKLWEPGHKPPRVCFEVVSEGHPYKDYGDIQDRYAAMGTRELIVFDPLLSGPSALGGPVALQIWRRDGMGILERVHFGPGPAFSEELAAWLHVEGTKIRICDDKDGLQPWLTGEQLAEARQARERAEKERERAEKERERAEKERALAEKERALAEKERERAEKEAVQERLAALEQRLADLGTK